MSLLGARVSEATKCIENSFVKTEICMCFCVCVCVCVLCVFVCVCLCRCARFWISLTITQHHHTQDVCMCVCVCVCVCVFLSKGAQDSDIFIDNQNPHKLIPHTPKPTHTRPNRISQPTQITQGISHAQVCVCVSLSLSLSLCRCARFWILLTTIWLRSSTGSLCMCVCVVCVCCVCVCCVCVSL